MSRRADIDGRALLVDAALELFATEGPDAVSIRAINRAAGLGPASVHYHFSTKDALLDEVLHLFGDDVVADIARHAQDLDSRPKTPTGGDVLNAIFESYHDLLSRHGQRGVWWIQLVDRYLATDPDRVTNGAAQPAVDAATSRAFPDADPEMARTALGLSVRMYVAELARVAPALVEGTAGESDRRRLALIRAYVSGGFESALNQALEIAQ